jgi:23S rRNA U2552 (ribose-2'-O)-methylase RlmE/FtsJ
MTCGIGNELNSATGSALSFNFPATKTVAVLDLCMAPGGFTTAALAHNPRASVHGITLPVHMGGYEIRIPRWRTDPRIVAIRFLDITMLAGEMGVDDIATAIPASHPDAGRFSAERPFEGEQFNLVFCGGTVVRNHARAAYREGREGIRLLTSQLVLAFNRICPGGTLVVVMHRADAWDSVRLLHLLGKFAEIQLFKPARAHARKSSFYAVARNVQSQAREAVEAVEKWKGQWREATLRGDGVAEMEGCAEEVSGEGAITDESVDNLLAEFGERLVRLTKPIFAIQTQALRTAPWVEMN